MKQKQTRTSWKRNIRYFTVIVVTRKCGCQDEKPDGTPMRELKQLVDSVCLTCDVDA